MYTLYHMSCPAANKAKGRINRPSLHLNASGERLVAASATVTTAIAAATAAETITATAAKDQDKDNNPATTASETTTTTVTHNQVTSFFVLQHIL